ncbi:MAG TPA: hypothetical protein V6C58_06005 [Allocoleopsis sp.]
MALIENLKHDNLTSSIVLKAIGNLEKLTGKDLYNNRRIILKYSGHFNNYNANVKYSSTMMQFNLSSNWKNIDEDIQIGLIESLLIKIFKIKGIKTDNMKLYEVYLKGLSKYARKHTHDPELEESFNRINEKFFDGQMEKPNLVFASESFHKLGSYEYATDTVKMSTIFQNLTEEEDKIQLDYVMYHELLHKKHTFNVKNGRHQAHTTAFRNDEKKFGEHAEENLTKWLRKKKYSNKSIFRRILEF